MIQIQLGQQNVTKEFVQLPLDSLINPSHAPQFLVRLLHVKILKDVYLQLLPAMIQKIFVI